MPEMFALVSYKGSNYDDGQRMKNKALGRLYSTGYFGSMRISVRCEKWYRVVVLADGL